MKQNKLKKYFCVILAVLMLIPLAACKNSSPPDDYVPPGDKDVGDIQTLGDYYTDKREYLFESGFIKYVNVTDGVYGKEHQGLYPEIACALSGEKYEYDINNVTLNLFYGMHTPNNNSKDMILYPEKYYAELEFVTTRGFKIPKKYDSKNPYILEEVPISVLVNSDIAGKYIDIDYSYVTRLTFGYSKSINIPEEFFSEYDKSCDDCVLGMRLSVYKRQAETKGVCIMSAQTLAKLKIEGNKVIFSPDLIGGAI